MRAPLGDPREQIAALRLIRTPHVGAITWRELVRRCGGASAALDALPDLARRGGRLVTLCPRAKAESELAELRRLGARLVVLGDGEYPASLAAIDDAPPVLALRGDGAVLARPTVAIVGARNASLNGVRVARRLAADLAAAGCAIVSGLARGIDTAAHDAAGPEATVAVLAGRRRAQRCRSRARAPRRSCNRRRRGRRQGAARRVRR